MIVVTFSTSLVDLKFQFHVIFSLIGLRPRALSVCRALRHVNLYKTSSFVRLVGALALLVVHVMSPK